MVESLKALESAALIAIESDDDQKLAEITECFERHLAFFASRSRLKDLKIFITCY